ncbi:FAD-dependent monooxygenase [Saccharopolyspora griseoalba]|uniref:FAD-dependent monooxygenase n=1 Tax=Saccharopolyspora griseoalba TaxID=1431848 RepID=A0ABW2LCE3_9PSEU
MTTRKALVVGAGSAGCATAILLAEGGWQVDLVEIKPAVTAIGSGITLQGNALRVLRRLGVWERVRASGFAFDDLGLRAPDGELLAEFDDVRTGGPDLPATLGTYRPELARALVERAREVGVRVRFGDSCTGFEHAGPSVAVTFVDGGVQHYHLVVGADGVRSSTRGLLGVDLETRPTGIGIWRAFVPRPESVARTDIYYGGRCYLAGYCPTGQNSLYAYLAERAQDRTGLSPAESLELMRELAGHYGGPWEEIRRQLTDPDAVHYTHFESHLLERPWHRGRVALAGDALHVCPPTLAQGAAQALEDAVALAEEVLSAGDATDAALEAYAARRFDRAKTVVEASDQLAQWLLDGERGDVPGLMARVSELVAQPV